MKHKKWTVRLAALLLTVSLAISSLSGCSNNNSNSSDTLNFGCINYSDSLDPMTQVNAAWAVSRYGIGEGLFHFDDEMNPQPYLCDTYEVNTDKTEWSFHLRDGIQFSNGKDVTPSAVVAWIERMYEMEATGQGSTNVSSYLKYESLTADDTARTVNITTPAGEYTDVPAVLAHPFFVILDIDSGEDFATKPIGTGPYAVDHIDTGVSVALNANEYYWQGDVPYAHLNMIFIADSTTKAMSLQNGDIDVAENITTSTDLDSLRNDSNFNVSETTGIRVAYTYLNEAGILENKDLRRAILMCVDDDTICKTTIGGMYTPGYSVLPSSLDYGYDQLTDTNPYNVEQAKQILDAAGIVDSNNDGWRELNGENINLRYLTYESRNLPEFAEAVTASLQAIGIQATIETTDADTQWNILVSGDYDMINQNWMAAQTGDPYGFLENWVSTSNSNYDGYSNPKYDALYAQLATTTDESVRKAIIVQLQQILIDDAVMLVHGYYNSNMCSDSSVSGANIHTPDYYWITTEIRPAG